MEFASLKLFPKPLVACILYMHFEKIRCSHPRYDYCLQILHQAHIRICLASLAYSHYSIPVKENKIYPEESCVQIMLGKKYNYSEAFNFIKLPSLAERRNNLLHNFGTKLLKSDHHKQLLPPSKNI